LIDLRNNEVFHKINKRSTIDHSTHNLTAYSVSKSQNTVVVDKEQIGYNLTAFEKRNQIEGKKLTRDDLRQFLLKYY
jgi:hypothetical protein